MTVSVWRSNVLVETVVHVRVATTAAVDSEHQIVSLEKTDAIHNFAKTCQKIANCLSTSHYLRHH